MKYIAVLVLAVLAMANAEEISPREETERAHYECQKDPANKIGPGASTNSYAAHTLCVGVKLGYLKPNGDVNIEALRKYVESFPGIDAAKVDTIVANCGRRNGASAEQAAIGMVGCVAKWTAP